MVVLWVKVNCRGMSWFVPDIDGPNDVTTGTSTSNPAAKVASYETKVEGGEILIRSNGELG